MCFSFLQYISAELCLSEGDDHLGAPTKEQLEQEKQLLLSFKPVMQKFLHDHTDLQVSALYALQVHCNTYAFPKGKSLANATSPVLAHPCKGSEAVMICGLFPGFCCLGMLLRYFVHFYDMEIIEEDAFLAWKEDITQEFPGKGKALFQVIVV